jgi:hypothetical protein
VKRDYAKPFVLQRFLGIRIGTLAVIAGLVFMQLGFEGIAPLSWDSPTATTLWGGGLYIAGLTWNGIAYLLERLER